MPNQSKALKPVNLYLAAVCDEEPGPGGWGCILEFGPHQKEMNSFMAGTTKTRMEIFALISGLGGLKESCEVTLYTNSVALHRAFIAHGLEKWPETGWKHQDGSPVEQKDLWMILKLTCRKHRINCIRMKDFTNAPSNQRCLELAKESMGEYLRINTPPPEEEIVFEDDLPEDEEEFESQENEK